MIRVLIADDHPIVRKGLRQLFADSPDVTVVGEVGDGREVLHAVETTAFDVLVLDLAMPRVSGMETLRRLRAQKPEVVVVVLSMYPEDPYGLRVMREGAAAYLSKDRPGEELLAAIRKVARGGTYVTETVADLAVRAPGRAGKDPHEALTGREYQVFMLILQGRSVTEIAAELDLTAGTVSGHLGRVKEKLGARSVAEIVSYAHRVGLAD